MFLQVKPLIGTYYSDEQLFLFSELSNALYLLAWTIFTLNAGILWKYVGVPQRWAFSLLLFLLLLVAILLSIFSVRILAQRENLNLAVWVAMVLVSALLLINCFSLIMPWVLFSRREAGNNSRLPRSDVENMPSQESPTEDTELDESDASGASGASRAHTTSRPDDSETNRRIERRILHRNYSEGPSGNRRATQPQGAPSDESLPASRPVGPTRAATNIGIPSHAQTPTGHPHIFSSGSSQSDEPQGPPPFLRRTGSGWRSARLGSLPPDRAGSQ